MIFLTGATGFLGSQLLGRLLVTYPDLSIALLVRSAYRKSSQERVDRILSELFPAEVSSLFATRVVVIEGDVLQERFGLSSAVYDKLIDQVSSVFHCAASVSFSQSIKEARAVNVSSTQAILDFVHFAQIRQRTKINLHYVSTAYVVGDTESIVSPHDINLDVPFKNTYEQSKAEAEVLARKACNDLHCVIYRPSIIVGDSWTGETSSFNVIYAPAKFLARGLLKVVPGLPYAPFDIVPVDYVADAIAVLSKFEFRSGSSFHLCAGVGEEVTLLELLDYLFLSMNRTVSGSYVQPPFLSPELMNVIHQSVNVALEGVRSIEKFLGVKLDVLQKILPYFSYMIRNPRFDTSDTISILKGVMDPPPAFNQYALRLFDYCNLTNWGKTHWTNPHEKRAWFQRFNSTPYLYGT